MWCCKSSRWSYTGFDHRCGHRRIVKLKWIIGLACQLLIPHQIALERDRVPQRDPRESAQQQGPGVTWMELQSRQQNPRATWMELQTCWASDVRQELRMMAQVEQYSSFPHAASRALFLLLENNEMVVLGNRQLWCLWCNVSTWHELKRCLRSWHNLLKSSWQRNTDVSSSLQKLIGIGELKLLSAAAGRVPWAFRWLFIEVHEQVF